LADSYLLAGRVDEGRKVFQRLLELPNDLGLLSEEYDTNAQRLVGNFPQALTHLALVNTALNLHSNQGPSHRRAHTGQAQ
jgi:GH15 family glucan-1,4-alpha-glucosidase